MRITFREHTGDHLDISTNYTGPLLALFVIVPTDMRYPGTQRVVPFSQLPEEKKHMEGCHENVRIKHHRGKVRGVPRNIT